MSIQKTQNFTQVSNPFKQLEKNVPRKSYLLKSFVKQYLIEGDKHSTMLNFFGL